MKGKESKETHFDILIASSPDINHHERQGTAQKVDARVGGNQCHGRDTKEKHEYEIGRPSSKIALFQ